MLEVIGDSVVKLVSVIMSVV